MDKAGVVLDSNGREQPAIERGAVSSSVDDEKLSVFRDFINSLDMDDLGKPKDD